MKTDASRYLSPSSDCKTLAPLVIYVMDADGSGQAQKLTSEMTDEGDSSETTDERDDPEMTGEGDDAETTDEGDDAETTDEGDDAETTEEGVLY